MWHLLTSVEFINYLPLVPYWIYALLLVTWFIFLYQFSNKVTKKTTRIPRKAYWTKKGFRYKRRLTNNERIIISKKVQHKHNEIRNESDSVKANDKVQERK